MTTDPEYARCSLLGYHECGGRITWEHAIIYAGKQVQERWAIIPLCERGHAINTFQDSGTMDKDMNHWVALNRATDETLRSISKAINYQRERDRLNGIYGQYLPPAIPKREDVLTK